MIRDPDAIAELRRQLLELALRDRMEGVEREVVPVVGPHTDDRVLAVLNRSRLESWEPETREIFARALAEVA